MRLLADADSVTDAKLGERDGGPLPWMIMLTLHLPDELADRLAVEAARRGMSVDELAAETLADRFPPAARPERDQSDPLEAFIGSGDSGDPSWAARPIGQLRAEAYKRQAG